MRVCPDAEVDVLVLFKRWWVKYFKAIFFESKSYLYESKDKTAFLATKLNRFQLLISCNLSRQTILLPADNPSITIRALREAFVVSLYDLRDRRCVQR